MDDFPIKINIKNGECVSQIVEAFKAAVASGKIPVNSVLPSRKALSKKLGVGEWTVRAAIKRLCDDDVVAVRRRVGCTVLEPGINHEGDSGDVLVVMTHLSGSFAANVSLAVMSSGLLKAGYRMPMVYLDCTTPKKVHGMLKIALKIRPRLVVVYSCASVAREVIRYVCRAGVPCFAPLQRGATRCKGLYAPAHTTGCGEALSSFVAQCCRSRILSICQFHMNREHKIPNDVCLKLESAGINVESISARPAGDAAHDLAEIQRAANRAMRKRLLCGALPDLFYFTDDYLAMGAITALLEAGVKIPEDVRIVTFANRGFGPVMSKSFARIEYDPVESGTRLLGLVLRILRTGEYDGSSHGVLRYTPGESFPAC